ncbi:MAG: N-acetyltransferase family protein [Pseudomonadota bacterium]|nr:N-acetyltransferase family protein [Pseudomonadota bacterium]
MEIRTANWEDLEAIVSIYNQAVAAGQKTADIIPVTVASRKQWFEAHDPHSYPILVAVYNDIIIGYLTVSAYRPGRMAVRHTAEVSYFVHFDYHHRGVASNLLGHAMHLCPPLHIKTLFAIIIDSNEYNIRLLENYGFKKWGHLPRVAEFHGVEVGHLYYGLRIDGKA